MDCCVLKTPSPVYQKRLHPSWAVEDSAEPSVQQPAEGVAGPGHEDRSPEPRASQSTVTNSSARGASVSQDSLYDATQPEYHPSSDGGVSEEDEPAPPMAPASPAIELLESPTPEVLPCFGPPASVSLNRL